jgi:hypothetical protein
VAVPVLEGVGVVVGLSCSGIEVGEATVAVSGGRIGCPSGGKDTWVTVSAAPGSLVAVGTTVGVSVITWGVTAAVGGSGVGVEAGRAGVGVSAAPVNVGHTWKMTVGSTVTAVGDASGTGVPSAYACPTPVRKAMRSSPGANTAGITRQALKLLLSIQKRWIVFSFLVGRSGLKEGQW